MSKVKKLKQTSFFDSPEEEHDTCPGCGKNTCFYIGASPSDIECTNEECKFYKKYTDEKRYYYGWEKPYEEGE